MDSRQLLILHDLFKKLVVNRVGTICRSTMNFFFHSFINISACKQKVIEMFQLIKVWY